MGHEYWGNKSGKTQCSSSEFSYFRNHEHFLNQSLFPWIALLVDVELEVCTHIGTEISKPTKQWKIKMDEDLSHEWALCWNPSNKFTFRLVKKKITHSEDKQIGYFFSNNGDSCIDKGNFRFKGRSIYGMIFSKIMVIICYSKIKKEIDVSRTFWDNGRLKHRYRWSFINNVFRENEGW